MNFTSVLERIRDSQYLIPVTIIIFGIGLAIVAGSLDGSTSESPFLLIKASAAAGRTLLTTVAGAIITVAGLVFSLSAITVQLASNQYSPRVGQGIGRDRYQQFVVGIVMGTFAYAITGLAGIGPTQNNDVSADWVVTGGVVLAILAAVLIVAYTDHVTRRVRVDDTMQRVTRATEETLAARTSPQVDHQDLQLEEARESVAVRAFKPGFVQDIDIEGLLEVLPPGSIGRLDVRAGSYVWIEKVLATVWLDPSHAGSFGDDLSREVAKSFAIGDIRTIDQDPLYGLQQLVDIGLRALSPGINDPATAVDVTHHLARLTLAAYRAEPTRRVFVADNVQLFAPHLPGARELLEHGLKTIFRHSLDHMSVLQAMLSDLDDLVALLDESGCDTSDLEQFADSVRSRLESINDPADQNP